MEGEIERLEVGREGGFVQREKWRRFLSVVSRPAASASSGHVLETWIPRPHQDPLSSGGGAQQPSISQALQAMLMEAPV